MKFKRMVDVITKQPTTDSGEATSSIGKSEMGCPSRPCRCRASGRRHSLPAGARLWHTSRRQLLAFGEPYKRTFAAIQTLGSAYAQAEERYFAQRKAYSSLDEEALSALTGVDRAGDIYHSALDRSNLVIERIIATPARTIRGLAIKAMVSRRECNGLPELIDSILADLIAIGAEPGMGPPHP